MKTLPPPIRHYLGQGKYSAVANQLMIKYGLHIDQGGILEREIMLLLMGIDNPDEFTKTLAEEAKLDQQTVNRIVQDVNAQIFVPLREEMRKGPQPQAAPASPRPSPEATAGTAKATQGTAREGVLQPRTTIIPANPNLPRPAVASGVDGPHPAQTLASVPRYVPPKKYFNLQNKIPPPAGSQTSAMREGSLTSTGQKLLEDHEEPHIDISEKVQVVSQPAVQRKVYEPPPNLPGVIQSAPIPEPPHAPSEATQGTAPPPLPPKPKQAVPVVPYSSDPYREPIDEK